DGDLLKGATFIGGSEADGLVDQGGLVPRKTTLVYNYADNFRGEVLIDSFGGIYVVATTSSPDFPVTNQAFQKSKGAGTDGCAFMLDSNLTQLNWSTFVGGNGDDALFSIRFNRDGDILLAGGTQSTDLPVSSDALQKGFAGGRADAFFLR